jgi:hypothetical protein
LLRSLSLLVGTMVEQFSLTFDAPPDGAAVSYERTQARLEDFRQMPWLEPE